MLGHADFDKRGGVVSEGFAHADRDDSIGIGRTRVIVLVQDLDIRIIDATTGELIRELALDTTKRYQSTRRPPGPTR